MLQFKKKMIPPKVKIIKMITQQKINRIILMKFKMIQKNKVKNRILMKIKIS